MSSAPKAAQDSTFLRDAALPFVEAREVLDGRRVCYAKHTHETFSIGAITAGCSTYLHGRSTQDVSAGDLVIVNPEEVHACNPIHGQAWSYRMFYVDAGWLGNLQQDLGVSRTGFQPFSAIASRDPGLYRGLCDLYDCLAAPGDGLHKQSALVAFFSQLHERLALIGRPADGGHRKLLRAAEFINDNATAAISLESICAAAQLSPSHLIRSFKKAFGLTPHAYQMNRRIQYCRHRLRQGHPIADVALEAGFADQAHLQREFKRLVAATPGQYRG